MLNNYLIFQLILVLSSSFYIEQIYCNESCWNNGEECNIKTELFKDLQFTNGISMQIDCRLNLKTANNGQDHRKNNEIDFQKSTQNLLLPRFAGVQAVILDGCQTPLNAYTYGMEYLPICYNITKAFIRHFHMDIFIPLYCGKYTEPLHLEYLNIQFNKIAAIGADSFKLNSPRLRHVRIENNFLKVIHKDAFKSIRSLENLYIANEPVLMLKFPDLFEYTSVTNIHLEALKEMTSNIFNHLPETLQNLYVVDTPFDDDSVLLKNSLVLAKVTIKNCALKQFTLHDSHSTLKCIDLSGNSLTSFTAYNNIVKELNISNNQLAWVPFEWLVNLTSLESLTLKGNQIKTLSLYNLIKALPNGHILDVSQNNLQYLQEYHNGIEDLTSSQIRLRSDQNPWDCLWLLEFAQIHPEIFRVLQYEKYISKINVNGLECVPAEKSLVPVVGHKAKNSYATTGKILNISTYTMVYGSPWEFKRNQRAEALIIVFMLPLGIAFLFLLLYMWIYCQKMFHLSYYQGISCIRRPANQSCQRFDVVRQLQQRPVKNEAKKPLKVLSDKNNEGYEVPIKGIISECNCTVQAINKINKCRKSVHVTQGEHLPNEEPPNQIYEEIIQVEESVSVNSKDPYNVLSFK